MFRINNNDLEVFLVHPGGPYWRNKNEGHWSVAKGEPSDGEGEYDLLVTAKREFEEETGIKPDASEYIILGDVIQKGGKKVYCWAFESQISGDPEIRSNMFSMEWPPGKGKYAEFPEADEGKFFKVEEARKRIKSTQEPFLDRLIIELIARKKLT